MIILLILMSLFTFQYSAAAQNFWIPAANISPAGDDWVPGIVCTPSGTLLAYSNNRGIFRSTNNGDDWNLAISFNPRVSNIISSPDGKVFAICNNTSGIYIQCSTDDGISWNEVYSAQHSNNFYSGSGMVFIDSSIAVAVISFTLGPTIGDIGVEVVRSTNGGLNWQRLFIANSWGGAEDLVKLQDGRILVTTTLSGVSYSSNNGSSWFPLTTFPPIFTSRIKTNSSGDIFLGRNTAASLAGLLFRSTDNGVSWETVGPLSGQNGGDLEALYIDHSGKIYISVVTFGPMIKTIYRSADNGSTWQELTSGIPSSQLVYSFTGNAEDVIFAGTQSTGVYKGWDAVPVELISFTAEAVNNTVQLKWTTGTETNNKGFQIQRKAAGYVFENIGFTEGMGTTSQSVDYNFIDSKVSEEKYTYRLKQLDLDGSFEYSPEIEIEISIITGFGLEQNYPNPFNPATKIRYTIPSISGNENQPVSLNIFDLLGSEVATLVNEEKPAGTYEITWNAENIPGGVYFCRLQSGSFAGIRKMVLMK